MFSYDESRRRFNRTLVVVAAGAALEGGEDRLTEYFYPGDETEMYAIPQSVPFIRQRAQRFTDTSTLDELRNPDRQAIFDEFAVSVQGMGRKHGMEYAVPLGVNGFNIPVNQLAMAYFNYSHNGITADSLGYWLRAVYSISRCVSYGTVSMGAPNILETHRQLAIRGFAAPIRRLTTVCSPTDLDDLPDPTLARFAGALSEVLEGGVATKLATGLGEIVLLDAKPDAGLVDKARWLFYNAAHGTAPRLANSQMRLFARTDLEGNKDDFRPVINGDTEAVLVACEYEDGQQHDGIVKCRQAREKLAGWLSSLGAAVTMVDNPIGAGHANAIAASYKIRPFMARSYGAE